MKKKESYIPDAFRLLEAFGYDYDKTEYYDHHAKRKHDYIGCIDIMAFNPSHFGCLGLQVTDNSHHSTRIKKAVAIPKLMRFLASNNRFQVWSWPKRRITDIWLDGDEIKMGEIDLPDEIAEGKFGGEYEPRRAE